MAANNSMDWLDTLVDQIQVERPVGDLIISSGHSPSGTYHVGTLREIMTANAITWALRKAGRTARHVDFVDDFDAFRKVPTGIGVPESWSQYLGRPLRVVPDPWECHDSYGAHFLTQLHEGLKAIGSMPDESVSGYDAYREGMYVDQIEQSLGKLVEIKTILTEVGGRALNDTWSPLQVLDEHGSLRNRRYTGWNALSKMVSWVDSDGNTGEVPINDGQVKLDWRLDWPGRWAKWGVSVEPFGRDHATKGGSYDTGVVLVDKIFGGTPPIPVPYEFINPLGATVKMSKSAGNVLTPSDALEVMPPELLRYFIVKNRPGRTLIFDSGLGLYQLIDEFVRERTSQAAGIAYAMAVSADETISSVPFSHLVAVYQAADGKPAEIKDMLSRTGYEQAVMSEWAVIKHELGFVTNWLAKYAPESVKFSLQTELPVVQLSEGQRRLLTDLAISIEAGELDAASMHAAIYAAATANDLKPADAFVALYRVLIGKDSGPKAGWFLASLVESDKAWLVARLRAGAASTDVLSPTGSLSVEIGGKTVFSIDEAVKAAFPATMVGYLIADLEVHPSEDSELEMLQMSLHEHGVSKDAVAEVPQIAVWRDTYRTFGIKPSDYRSSVEALVRRTLDGKPAAVNSVVDAYNAVSVSHLLPMGAMDLEHVSGEIRLRFGIDGETAELLGMDKPVEVKSEQVVYGDDKRIITWLWNYRDAKDTAVTEATKRAIFFIDSLTGADGVQSALNDLVLRLEKQAGFKLVKSGILG